MNRKRTNFEFIQPIFTLLAMFVLGFQVGCGGSSPSSKQTTAKRAPRSRAVHGGDVASQTRAATLRRQKDWNLTSEAVQAVAPLVKTAAEHYDLPEDLIFGIIWVESRFNPEAKSGVGARGLMQLMPKTATYLAECIKWDDRVDSTDPKFNITAGTYYIAKLIKRFDGREDLALAAYNAGPSKVRRWLKSGGLPKVSVEYHTMVQTARDFFGSGERLHAKSQELFIPTTEELDRLGLAILIAGLEETEFGLERVDSSNPFK